MKMIDEAVAFSFKTIFFTGVVYWHPMSTDSDLQVSAKIYHLAESISKIRMKLEELSISINSELEEFQ
jgi:hypothetical protein